jgi:hypothetical protein
MIRVSTLIWVMLVALSGYVMFQVKAEVGRLDKRLAAVNHQIADDRDRIHTLNVEWATLTQPERLDTMSQHVLQLQSIRTYVLGSYDQVPLRDDAVAPAAPATSNAQETAQLAEISPKAPR